MLFDLGNNVDHASFGVTNPKEAMDVPPPNHVDVVDSELIT